MYYLIKGSTLVGKADVAPNIEDLCSFGMDVVEDARNLDISMHECIDGVIRDKPVVEYTATEIKAQKIAEIKAYYDKRFETLEQMVLHRRLSNGDITDLQEQYKKLNAEMLVKIKAV